MARNWINWILSTTIGAIAVGALACAQGGDRDLYEKRARVEETQSHTGGQALHERKGRMQRTQRDLMHIQRTLETLRRHRYDGQIAVFASFVRPYLAERVDPLISDRDASWHPELVPLDANLLFAKAAVLAELRDGGAVNRVARVIDNRFAGMDSLIVEYPRGEQRTVGESLAQLRRDARRF